MVSEQAMKTRNYHRKRDPHWGNKINSKDDLLIRAVKILKKHPDGLSPRGLISELLPYEGQYHIPSTNYLGRLLGLIGGTFKEGNKWKYSEDVA